MDDDDPSASKTFAQRLHQCRPWDRSAGHDVLVIRSDADIELGDEPGPLIVR